VPSYNNKVDRRCEAQSEWARPSSSSGYQAKRAKIIHICHEKDNASDKFKAKPDKAVLPEGQQPLTRHAAIDTAQVGQSGAAEAPPAQRLMRRPRPKMRGRRSAAGDEIPPTVIGRDHTITNVEQGEYDPAGSGYSQMRIDNMCQNFGGFSQRWENTEVVSGSGISHRVREQVEKMARFVQDVHPYLTKAVGDADRCLVWNRADRRGSAQRTEHTDVTKARARHFNEQLACNDPQLGTFADGKAPPP